jgi:photosystem II stability/assembly factor-like uncharacterized protein
MRSILYTFIALLCVQAIGAQGLNADGLFGDLRARHIGPALMSGRVTDITGHPSKSRILYVGAAGGGVWRTNDGGITFEPLFDKHPQSIGAVAVDPKQPDQVLWVGTGEIWTRNSVSVGKGLYKSTDGGRNWKLMGLEDSERISSIQINPDNPDEIYVGVLGALWGDSEVRGVYKTTDGGENWAKILYTDPTTGCSDLTMHPEDPNTLYASMWEFRRTAWSFNSGGYNSALYKSTDGGENWEKIHNGFPEGKLGRIAVAIAPSKPDVLYAVIESEKNEDKGLYRSDDGGQSWRQLNNDFELTVRPFYFSRIVVDPTNADKVCKAGLRGAISEDGGKTFRQIGSGVHADVHDFWFDPNNSDHIFLGCDGGVYRSYDGGRSWEMCKDLPLTQFYHVTVDMQEPFNVYGGMQDNGSWVGPSASVGGVEARDWQEVGYGDGFRVYPHPSDPNICYSEMQGAASIWRVDLEKQQSKIIKPYPVQGDPKLRFNWNTPITTSQFEPDRLYVGSQFVHRSNDQGETWVKISPDLTTNDPAKQNQEESGGLSKDNSGAENHCTIFTIAESPLDEAIIWVGTDDGQVQLTTDGGQNWANVTGNLPDLPPNTWVYHIEPSSFDPAVAYAVFDGHTQNDRNTYVYKTEDSGQSWQSIATPEIEGFARSIQEDFVNPGLLYLGTEMGLYITLDGGQNWTPFTNNMPAVAVHHVTLHPRDHSLVMGTHGRGVIIIDDVRPLRALKPEVLEQDVYFFESPPVIIKEQPSFGSSASYGEFVGSNPSSAAKLTYFMKKRHIFGKMTMEVLNKDGEQVASLTPGKAKGINIVNWNYRLRRPKIAKAKTFSFGGFATPTVPPGTYTVRLVKGKETYEHTIELAPDPNSVHSAEERALQHETVMELYDMNEELAYQVDRIEQLKTGLAKMEAAALPKKLQRQLQAFEDQLEATRKTLVVTTGDNYVASAEPQLREKIADLYSEVAGYLGKPSNAQLEALELRQRELKEAISAIDELMRQLPKINKQLEHHQHPALEYRSKESFLMADQ